jgi:hypothetical protein
MNLESDKRLKFQVSLDFSSTPTGEARQARREDIESLPVVNEPERPANTRRIMEEVCERGNLKEALRQVRGNKGSAGIDRMTVDQLGDYLKQHWPAIREQLLNGTYEPKPVRRVGIPKPDGGGVPRPRRTAVVAQKSISYGSRSMEDRGGRLLLRRSGITWGHPRPMQNVPEFLRTVGCERYGGKSRDPSGRSRGAPARRPRGQAARRS